MEPSPVIDALEQNVWHMFSVLGLGEGGELIDTPTRLVVSAPVPQPPYNGVWRFYDEGDRPLGEQVAEVLAPLRARGVDLIWVVHPTAPPDLRGCLADEGLEMAEEIWGMSRPLENLEPIPPMPEGIEVIEATPADVGAWLHLVTWRYGLETTASPYLRRVFEEGLRRGTRMWIALDGDEPVSKVAVVPHDGAAGIYAVATTERGRNKGLASLLTLTALHAARDAGIALSVLHATPMARSLYRRLGYAYVAPFEIWAEPGRLHL